MVEMRFNIAGPLTLITLSMSDIQPRRILLFDQKIILKERQIQGFPGGTSGKEHACQCRRHKRSGFDPWVGKTIWRKKWPATAVFLPGESHGERNLVGYGPWGQKESEQLHRYHNFFIHASADGHLGCFYVLTIANSLCTFKTCPYSLFSSQNLRASQNLEPAQSERKVAQFFCMSD